MSDRHKLVGDRPTKPGLVESDDDEWSDDVDDEPKSRVSIERRSSSKDRRYNSNYSPKYKDYYPDRAEDEQKTARGEPGDNSDSWCSDNEKTPTKKYDKDNNSDDDDSPAEHLVSAPREQVKAIQTITFKRTKNKLGIQFGLKTSRFTGPLVTIASVEKNSLADGQGIKRDWVLTHLDGEEISVLNSEDFAEFINKVAKKRDKGLTLSFNTLLLPRLKRRMSTMDQTAPRMEGTPPLSREARKDAHREAERELEDRLAAVDSHKDMDLINLRSAIERAKELKIDTSHAKRKLKVAEILNLFETMKRWEDPEHARCMTDHEKEMTDLEQRISNLTSAIQCARELGMETRDAMNTNWKLQGIYRYCKKLGPMSKETRFFLMRMQELWLEIEQADALDEDDSRRTSSRMRELKKKVKVAMRNAIDSQKPKALKVMIKVAKKCKVDSTYISDVTDVIEGITQHSLTHNTIILKECVQDAERLNIPADHISDYVTFLETQKLRVTVIVRDKSEGHSPGEDRRRSRRKKKKKRRDEDIKIFKMFKFDTLRDLKLQAFKKHKISYYTQQWRIDGKEITDEQETLEELGVNEKTELELFVGERKQMGWVTSAVLDEVKNMEELLVQDMQDSKERLVSAIKDKDFHNFLRFSSQLRRQWCKKTTTKVHRDEIQEQYEKAQKREQQKHSRRGYYERSSSYSTAGGSSSSRSGRDSGSRRYDRDRDGFRDRYYDSPYAVTAVGGVHCIQEETPGYSRRSKDYDEY